MLVFLTSLNRTAFLKQFCNSHTVPSLVLPNAERHDRQSGMEQLSPSVKHFRRYLKVLSCSWAKEMKMVQIQLTPDSTFAFLVNISICDSYLGTTIDYMRISNYIYNQIVYIQLDCIYTTNDNIYNQIVCKVIVRRNLTYVSVFALLYEVQL